MLKTVPALLAEASGIHAMIAAVNGRSPAHTEMQVGIHHFSHWSANYVLRDAGVHHEEHPVLSNECAEFVSCYGVCDGPENLLQHMPWLKTSPRIFAVTLTPVHRDPNNKGKGGGWRWHKWGPYIGKHVIEHEYLDDEEGIDFVYCYHIYELLP